MPDRTLADKRKLAGELVEYLNGLAAIDPAAVLALVDTRVTCNQAMADHPTLQVRYDSDAVFTHEIGLLGILNGFVGTDDKGYGFIQRIVDDEDPEAISFCVAPE